MYCPLLSSSEHSGVLRTPNPQLFQVLGFTPTLGQVRVATTPGKGIPFPECLLLFSPLHYTQSPGTVTHLSHTHYVCEAPPDHPVLLLLLASCIVATHINSFSLSFLPSFLPSFLTTLPQPTTSILLDNPLPNVWFLTHFLEQIWFCDSWASLIDWRLGSFSFLLSFFLGLKSILYIALLSNFVGFFFCYVENKPNGGEIPSERERKRRNSLCAKPWVQRYCGKAARSFAVDLCQVSRVLLHCWVLGFPVIRGTRKAIEG